MSLPLRNWKTIIPHHVYFHEKRKSIRIYDYQDPEGPPSTFIEFELKPADEDDKIVRYIEEGKMQGEISFFDFWMQISKNFRK
ncbi:MAG: hypothetical protein V3U54_13340 [Thermodesulfobacteriota bacterium]